MNASEDNATTLVVPTVTSKKDTTELDMTSIAEDDLKSLQKSDPFLYYSIPAVWEAELSLKEVDHSQVLQVQTARSVTRSTRISFERDAISVMNELFDDYEVHELDDFNFPNEIEELLLLLAIGESTSSIDAEQQVN